VETDFYHETGSDPCYTGRTLFVFVAGFQALGMLGDVQIPCSERPAVP